MFKNHFKIAWRHLIRNKFYSGISVFGLTISMASCLLMLLYVHNELNYDKHNTKGDRIYRVAFDGYQNLGPFATTPLPVGPALEKNFPEITNMTRIATGMKSMVRYERNGFFETIAFVDTGVTQIFTIPFVMGNPDDALRQPFQVIISERLAKKYFGSENPMGKTLEIGSNDQLNSIVTGVFKDFPQNAHIRFDLATSFLTFEEMSGWRTDLWTQMPSNYTYLLLKDKTSATDLSQKLPSFVVEQVGEGIKDWRVDYNLVLQPLQSIHLSSHLNNEFEPNGNRSTIFMLGSIALLVLLIACFNYINYATARFVKRAREVSIRKVIGAARKQLITQFIGETLLIVLVAGGLSLFLIELLLPVFNNLTGKSFSVIDLRQMETYGSLALMTFFVGIGAGIFPAVFLSAFNPAHALKGRFAKLSIATGSRKFLVVTQFTISVFLLVATIVVYQQMQFAKDRMQPGHDHLVVTFPINKNLSDKYETLKQELLKQIGIINVSAASNMPTFYGDSWPLRRSIGSDPVQTENYALENDFIETLGLSLIVGRPLDKKRQSDVSHGFILNETGVKRLGFESPEQALDQTIYWGSEAQKEGIVVGVVKDFHFSSLHNKIEPAILQFKPFEWMRNQFVIVKIEDQAIPQTFASIKNVVKQVDAEWISDLKYLDDNFAQLHQKDLQQGRIFGAFSLLALLISCLGILGLTANAAEQRKKEIGIRKVLGASISNIIALLSKDFLILILISLSIATPASWILMKRWLENFAYQIDMQWWIFGLVGLIALSIAFFTIFAQSMKTAIANPVDALRNE